MKSITWAGVFLGLAFVTACARQQSDVEPNLPAGQRLLEPFGFDAETTTDQKPTVADKDDVSTESADAISETPDVVVEASEATVRSSDESEESSEGTAVASEGTAEASETAVESPETMVVPAGAAVEPSDVTTDLSGSTFDHSGADAQRFETTIEQSGATEEHFNAIEGSCNEIAEPEVVDMDSEEVASELQNETVSRTKMPRVRLAGFLTPQPVGTELAACDGCGHEWTNCCCNRCGWTVFGEWLLLQPRNADVLYAERALNCFTPPIGTEQIDFGAFSGYKVGLARTLHGGCSEIVGTFTRFESVEEDRAVPTTGTDVLRPVLAFDPFVTCDDSTSTSARAKAGIDFERADVDYRAYIDHGCCRFDWLVGFGYGELKQDVQAIYDAGRVNVESNAWGYGLRLGGGTQYGKGCIRGFGHLDLTLLASNLKASYAEIDDGTGVVRTNARVERDLDRIIPVLDLEVGLAVDLCKNTVLKCGYVYSIWYNVVTVPEYVEAVQSGDLSGPSDTLTFDGVFARLEYAW